MSSKGRLLREAWRRNPKAAALVLALVIGVALWNHYFPGEHASPPKGSSLPAESTDWARLENPELVSWGGNDGDSFRIRHAGGTHTVRLYFVDTPEKTDRFPDRLGHQARYFNNISIPRTMEVGQEARAFTRTRLEESPFEVWTRWEPVMQSERIYALVRFPTRPEHPWLHETLVSAGLARIYTMPTDMPDGTPKKHQLSKLHHRERDARRAGRGAWGSHRR